MTGTPNSTSPSGPSLADGACCQGYAPLAGLWDEMLDAAGAVRPHWQPLVQALNGLGLPELIGRWTEAKHLIRENGVTYNVYGDPRGMDRPWQLDPIPLLIRSADGD